MNKENVELKNNNLGITEDDFGCMLYKLMLLNESFSYYLSPISLPHIYYSFLVNKDSVLFLVLWEDKKGLKNRLFC